MSDISLEKVVPGKGSSFCAVAYKNAYFAAPLHVHPEYELILIEEGQGLSFVGDSVQKLRPGDFMLIGSNLPHLWLSADEYYMPDTPLRCRSVYSQFGTSVFPAQHTIIPELTAIMVLLENSHRGIRFENKECGEIVEMFRELPVKEGLERLLHLYRILNELAVHCSYRFLTSEEYKGGNSQFAEDSITKRAMDYINKYYQNDISLDSIADYVGMNPSALCRYFKRKTGKKLFDYVTELRVAFAAKLLINSNISISRIAYDCGYNNLSHFNRQFKSVTSTTPTEYRKLLFKGTARNYSAGG